MMPPWAQSLSPQRSASEQLHRESLLGGLQRTPSRRGRADHGTVGAKGLHGVRVLRQDAYAPPLHEIDVAERHDPTAEVFREAFEIGRDHAFVDLPSASSASTFSVATTLPRRVIPIAPCLRAVASTLGNELRRARTVTVFMVRRTWDISRPSQTRPFRFRGTTVRLRSTAVAECVSAPMLMTSTPGNAKSRNVSKRTRPDTSTTAAPAIAATARRINSGDMLSSKMTSAPARKASLTSARVVASTSIFAECGAAAGEFHARVSDPAAAIWLS